MGLPLGTIALLIAAILVYFGVAQRLLDRMRLSDRATLVIIFLIVAGSYLPDIPLGSRLSVNIGGGLIPIGFAIYLWFSADQSSEKWRALWATLITTAAIYAATIFLPAEPQTFIIDPSYAFAIIAGLTAYLLGRSRRASFIAGILGIALNDIIYAFQVSFHRQAGHTTIGGAGIFDTIVLSALLAVALAELVGETREKLGDRSHLGEEGKLVLYPGKDNPEEGEER